MPAASHRAGPSADVGDGVSPMTIDDEEPKILFMGKNLRDGRRRRARGPRKNQKNKTEVGTSTGPAAQSSGKDMMEEDGDDVQEITLNKTVVLSDSDEYEEDDVVERASTDSDDQPGHRYERVWTVTNFLSITTQQSINIQCAELFLFRMYICRNLTLVLVQLAEHRVIPWSLMTRK